MEIILLMLIVPVPLLGMLLWATLRERQIDKYNEWLKQQEGDAKP